MQANDSGVRELTDGFAALTEICGEGFEKRLTQAVLQASADCFDRPGVKAARKVTAEFQFKPLADDAGNCVDIAVIAKCSAAAKLPDVKMPEAIGEVLENGNARFRPRSPKNPRQKTFDEG